MGTVTKRGQRYQARIKVTKDFIQQTESKTFDTKLDALMWIEVREKEIRRGINNEFDDTKKLKNALIRYRDEVSPTKKGARWEIIRINKFLRDELLPINSLLTSLTTNDFRKWRDSRMISNSSKNREVALLRSVIDIARREWLWLNHEPLKDLRSLQEPPPRNRRISDAEITLILEDLRFNDQKPIIKKQEVAIIFLIALETGMRLSEIVTLDWSQINLQQRFLTLLSTKNGDKRDVPLSRRAIDLFILMGNKKKGDVFSVTPGSASATFLTSVKKCKIIDLTFHDSRHEATTRLAQKLDVLDLAKVIGHRDPRSLMIYYNPTASELAAKLD